MADPVKRVSASVGGIAASRFSASFAMPQQRCAGASAFGSAALVVAAESSGRSALKPTGHEPKGRLA